MYISKRGNKYFLLFVQETMRDTLISIFTLFSYMNFLCQKKKLHEFHITSLGKS
jgi:hypothetical protein